MMMCTQYSIFHIISSVVEQVSNVIEEMGGFASVFRLGVKGAGNRAGFM
jgi:hypothetical protein